MTDQPLPTTDPTQDQGLPQSAPLPGQPAPADPTTTGTIPQQPGADQWTITQPADDVPADAPDESGDVGADQQAPV